MYFQVIRPALIVQSFAATKMKCYSKGAFPLTHFIFSDDESGSLTRRLYAIKYHFLREECLVHAGSGVFIMNGKNQIHIRQKQERLKTQL